MNGRFRAQEKAGGRPLSLHASSVREQRNELLEGVRGESIALNVSMTFAIVNCMLMNWMTAFFNGTFRESDTLCLIQCAGVAGLLVQMTCLPAWVTHLTRLAHTKLVPGSEDVSDPEPCATCAVQECVPGVLFIDHRQHGLIHISKYHSASFPILTA